MNTYLVGLVGGVLLLSIAVWRVFIWHNKMPGPKVLEVCGCFAMIIIGEGLIMVSINAITSDWWIREYLSQFADNNGHPTGIFVYLLWMGCTLVFLGLTMLLPIYNNLSLSHTDFMKMAKKPIKRFFILAVLGIGLQLLSFLPAMCQIAF